MSHREKVEETLICDVSDLYVRDTELILAYKEVAWLDLLVPVSIIISRRVLDKIDSSIRRAIIREDT